MPRNRAHLRKPIPEGFTEAAPTMTINELEAKFNVSWPLVTRWLRETGIEAKRYRRPMDAPIPDDLAEHAKTEYVKHLVARYRVGRKRILSWLKELGIEPLRLTTSEITRKAWDTRGRAEHRPAQSKRWVYSGPRQPVVMPKDTSIEGQAADTLRPYAPCYRCDEKGRANLKGPFWRYGNVVLTADELLERASAKGWRIAA